MTHPASAEDPSAIRRLFDETRRRLVETGTRNRLVHVNRANARGPVVNIINERADAVHAILTGGRAMRFRALGEDAADADTLLLAGAAAEPAGDERHHDQWLETRLGPDALAKKLLLIAREARTAEEEQGVNLLYLALGFVTWFEDAQSAVVREAPLVLLPVEIKRNERTSTHELRLRQGEEVLTNLPLQQRWADDFGIVLPDLDADAEGWSPARYHQAVEAAITEQPRWLVDRDAIQLGFFSFSKLLMHRDLSLDAWPDHRLETHDLTRGLLFEGFRPEPPLFAPDERLDAALPPERLFHVVDADASQAKVIEEVRAGRNLVVQGPPGTGKSQTITNIIAAAAREGRTVLFVAEKMAALSVVHDRLVKAGLRDLALELHSRSANKKAVLAELARTLAAAQAVPALAPAAHALHAARDRLNAISDALHQPIGDSGETPYSVLGRQARFIGAGTPAPTIDAAAPGSMTRAEEAAALALIAEGGALIAAAGPPDRHPLAGVSALDLQPVALARLGAELPRAAAAARNLHDALDAPMAAAGWEGARAIGAVAGVADLLDRLSGLAPADAALAARLLAVHDPAPLARALDAGIAWQGARAAFHAVFVPAALDAAVAPLRATVAAGAQSMLARWGFAYRRASRALAGLVRDALPRPAPERLALLDRLDALQACYRAWLAAQDLLARALGEAWQGEHTDFAHALAVARWCAQARDLKPPVSAARLVTLAADAAALARMAAGLDEAAAAVPAIEAPLAALALAPARLGGTAAEADLLWIAEVAEEIAGATGRYGEWAALCRTRAALQRIGLGGLATRMAEGLPAAAAADELRFARAERLWTDAVRDDPLLAALGGMDRHALVARFAALERERLRDNVSAIRADHLAQLPQGAQGEMKLLRGEMAKRRAHLALRRLFKEAPHAIQRIKPVLLMSPISVAQYLTPGRMAFDLLVIDEASQVRPEDALGAIARAGQIVVVGDQKQLPPSTFFDRLLADGEEDAPATNEEEALLGGAAALGQMESILTLCEARGLPSRMLRWHYRSRDPSLMRVSNAEFYDGALVLPPSPLERDPAYGLRFTQVDGAYDKGGRRDNRLEGEALVARVAQHARETPELSLGIVTFSHAQQTAITELLELARRTDPALDLLLREGRGEDVFVKNIENVQGDERDVILVSIGYGPTEPGGRMIGASFGAVNGEGGERRLNVLFTRARLRCEIFASFDPADLDVSRAARSGPRILKRFLDYANTGRMEQATPTGRAADSPFEEDVAQAIRDLGFLPDPQVGSAGFRIDIGVRHPDRPGTYLLAVECDGATYHSALWARERDRLRQDVLEQLGWRFYRIWSTDWFYRRPAEIERLRAALDAARAAADAPVRVRGANADAADRGDATAPGPAGVSLPEATARVMPAYARTHPTAGSSMEPHDAPVTMLLPLVRAVVAGEGPVHLEEIARRVAGAFGRKGAGRRVVAATQAALEAAARADPTLEHHDAFWFTAAQAADPPVRDRSGETGATTRAEALSGLEIRAALRLAREDTPGGSDEEVIRVAARLMGFRRAGGEITARFAEELA